MSIIDHLSFNVTNSKAAIAFYEAALAPLGITIQMRFPAGEGEAAGFGRDGKPEFFIAHGAQTAPHLHLAFTAASHAEVDAFYASAIKAGGKDNGKPGIRAQYHPHYYGAFVIDADGHNIEAVCHTPA